MKRSDYIRIKKGNFWPGLLMWVLPVVLLVPSAVLSCTEYLYTPSDRVANVLVPAGVYMLLAACWKRIGITTVLSLPLMVLCAFQIVLLYLYGESIIAIDMFLNVVTTNVSEATELLGNLVPAILTVCAIYLPPLVTGIVLSLRGHFTTGSQRRPMLVAGGVTLACGLVAMGCAYAFDRDYSPVRSLFPANVISNMFEACERTEASNRYDETSADFSFGSVATRPDSADVYVLVIGETSRAGNWQLNGYERPTNPRLSRRDGVNFFSKALSESNTTHKSVPLLMSGLDSSNYGDSIYSVKGVIDAFKEAGFATAWISSQERNGSLIDFFGEQADSVRFLMDDGRHHRDTELVPCLAHVIDAAGDRPLFVVIHTYGSHFNYRDRYPDGFGAFLPDDATEAEVSNRDELINAYDNAIMYTDLVLDSIIATVESTGRSAALLYLADHGEDIFDDSRGRFLHASPSPTYYQLHVPVLTWTSEAYRRRHPHRSGQLEAHADCNVSSSLSAFHTIAGLAGLSMPCYRPEADLSSRRFEEPVRLYLNDYNEAVPLVRSGLREVDIEQLGRRSISCE